jgi:transposase
MHIVLLAAEDYSATKIARALFCSRTTVYAIVARFIREGQEAFDDRERRGPAPLVESSARKLIEDLTEGVAPTERGWLRSRWSCKLLALELFKERALVVSRETVRRVLHHLGFRWGRPRPVPPPEDPEEKRKRLEDILEMLRREWSFFQDETKLETNPRVGFCWMRKGKQKRLRTPGTNRKAWISGALRWSTGRFHWVVGERKNGELFMKLLEELRSIYGSEKQRLENWRWTTRREPHQQTGRAIRGGFLWAACIAPASRVEPAKQSGGADLVGTARGGKPQP